MVGLVTIPLLKRKIPVCLSLGAVTGVCVRSIWGFLLNDDLVIAMLSTALFSYVENQSGAALGICAIILFF